MGHRDLGAVRKLLPGSRLVAEDLLSRSQPPRRALTHLAAVFLSGLPSFQRRWLHVAVEAGQNNCREAKSPGGKMIRRWIDQPERLIATGGDGWRPGNFHEGLA